jgi:hypothetical protein
VKGGAGGGGVGGWGGGGGGGWGGGGGDRTCLLVHTVPLYFHCSTSFLQTFAKVISG